MMQIITHVYDRKKELGFPLGVYVHDLKKHEPEYMDFFVVMQGSEHSIWYDLHRSVFSENRFETMIEEYQLTCTSENILQPWLYQEMVATMRRFKLTR